MATGSSTGKAKAGRPASMDASVVCAVCGDRSTGVHYGVEACEGCKGFFRRAMLVATFPNLNYKCANNHSCAITTETRNTCQSCRLRKCLQLGMSKDGIKLGRRRKDRTNTPSAKGKPALPTGTSTTEPLLSTMGAGLTQRQHRRSAPCDLREIVEAPGADAGLPGQVVFSAAASEDGQSAAGTDGRLFHSESSPTSSSSSCSVNSATLNKKKNDSSISLAESGYNSHMSSHTSSPYHVLADGSLRSPASLAAGAVPSLSAGWTLGERSTDGASSDGRSSRNSSAANSTSNELPVDSQLLAVSAQLLPDDLAAEDVFEAAAEVTNVDDHMATMFAQAESMEVDLFPANFQQPHQYGVTDGADETTPVGSFKDGFSQMKTALCACTGPDENQPTVSIFFGGKMDGQLPADTVRLSPEAVLDNDLDALRRIRTIEIRAPMPPPFATQLTIEEDIKQIVAAHMDTCNFTFEKLAAAQRRYVEVNGPAPLSEMHLMMKVKEKMMGSMGVGGADAGQLALANGGSDQLAGHFLRHMFPIMQRVIDFYKRLPHLNQLDFEFRIYLAKKYLFCVILPRFADMVDCGYPQMMWDFDLDCKIPRNMVRRMHPWNKFLDPLFDMSVYLQELQLDDEEKALYTAFLLVGSLPEQGDLELGETGRQQLEGLLSLQHYFAHLLYRQLRAAGRRGSMSFEQRFRRALELVPYLMRLCEVHRQFLRHLQGTRPLLLNLIPELVREIFLDEVYPLDPREYLREATARQNCPVPAQGRS